MLKLTMNRDDYLTINGNIVVHLTRAAGGHAEIAVYAPREIPILRGAVLERLGGERPECLNPPKKPRRQAATDPFSSDLRKSVEI